MATVAGNITRPVKDFPQDRPLEWAIDRWIYVFMAAWFIAIVLAGFIPSSLAKIAAVQAGERPPFPMILHLHAILMGSFLLLLFAQTWLAATGRCGLHRRFGMLAFLIAPALVFAGLMLVPANYHGLWAASQAASPETAEQMAATVRRVDNIMLLQLRIGILFPILLAIALRARRGDSGLHKRLMILTTALALPAGIDRIPWLPATLPESPISPDLYTLLAVSPLFVWDVARHRTIHRAWKIWFAFFLIGAIFVHGLWDTDWWHSTAPWIMRV
jgi:hypothetical protein